MINKKEELLGKKVQYTTRHQIVRGTIIEVDDDTFVVGLFEDVTIRYRIPYSSWSDRVLPL